MMKFHELNIIGYTWSGGKGTYTNKCRFAPVSAPEVKSLAVDFESVIDWQVISHSTDVQRIGTISRTITDMECVKNWNDPASEDVWNEYDATNL